MDDIIKKCIDNVVDKTAKNTENLSVNRIKKADYDRTLIGFVSEKIVPEKPKDDTDFKWRIQTNGTAYDIKPDMCNITDIGQRVRLYIPNHSYKNKYAEVIDNYCYTHPQKVVFDNNADTITETWKLNDNTIETKVFQFDVINKDTPAEEVTAIHFPDGSVMSLEGF